MKTKTKQDQAFEFVIAASLVSSMITILIAVYPPKAAADLYLQRQLIGTVFAAICVCGAIAALYPQKCVVTSEAHPFQPVRKSDLKNRPALSIKGHHPDCGEFQAHTLHFGGAVYCAACSGLFAGAVVSLAATAVFFFLGVNIGELSLPAVVVGQAGVLIGLVEFEFKGWFRSLANVFFVLGGCLILIGIDQRVHSLFIDVFVVGALLLWIFARIVLSQWDHSRTCARCEFSCRIDGRGQVV